MHPSGVIALAVVPTFCFACAAEPEVPLCPTAVSVVDLDAFDILDAAADPFESLDGGTSTTATTTRPRCSPSDVRVEVQGMWETFTIETRYCSRVTVVSPTLEDLEAHEALNLRLWHGALIPYGPTTAHLLVTLDGDAIYDATLPIPESSGLIDVNVACPRDIPAGSTVAWHVSNHGVNSWNWLDLTAIRSRPCAP